jgi:hypothetical protein
VLSVKRGVVVDIVLFTGNAYGVKNGKDEERES